ncbi:MAG: hypothetical protein MK108_13850 [Mariniblastus sp.]|nr:hypothetical protein [Mariniblastus sp.]
MKRSAAILGPTPSFVRWAIRIECPLRDTDEQDLPDRAFRELRGLRELSHGLRQDRVLDGICIHPKWNRDVDSAKGFFSEEVCEVFGGANQVDSSCTNCPANVCQRVSTESTESGRQRPVWAGCYGWFPSRHGKIDYPLLFQDAWRTCGSHPPIDGLLETDPYWYGLWQVGHWSGSTLQYLNRLIEQVRQQLAKSGEEDRNLIELAAAARECLQSDLTLVAELIPQGYSDGLHWSIEPHCPDCGKEMSPQQIHCAACGRQGRPHPKTRKKVLGERPYRLLKEMIGPEKTAEIILAYGSSIDRQDGP